MSIISLALVGAGSFGAGVVFGAMVLQAKVGPWYGPGSTSPAAAPVPPDMTHHSAIRMNAAPQVAAAPDRLQIVYMQVDRDQIIPVAVTPDMLPSLPALPPAIDHDGMNR
ncbi:hypothetical protein [Nonomuraea ceibae]|uniref:hypothetical protein n=1 Tax=Nonomuraea ceibae TaxID=1935170 RepID=UPI001C5CFDAE|nr:hypothetical protein [Nonomuraea ceibae]